MSFNILYVEDEEASWRKIKFAVDEHNANIQNGEEILDLSRVENPEELKGKLESLGDKFDLVLADVYFKNPKTGANEDRLDDIIKYIRDWSKNQRKERRLPIIVYTVGGKDALKSCLERKAELNDIWDKNTAWAEYVAWRFTEKSKELARIRPDALVQRKIREMDAAKSAPWHERVVEMTKRYDAGLTEADQIKRAGFSILEIATEMQVYHVCEPLWEAMTKWESISRSIFPSVRGHARHVINVFWLGYYLLNHELLRGLFNSFWDEMKKDRMNMSSVYDVSAVESVNDVWFYASLFHDVGGCIEKSKSAYEKLQGLFKKFGDLQQINIKIEEIKGWDSNNNEFKNQWLAEFDPKLQPFIKTKIEDGLKNKTPDQGLIGALFLRKHIADKKQNSYAREAGRAMSLHNIFPKLGDEFTDKLPITWQSEPFVCLLLLCDQLQTWDRQRDDEDFLVDSPTRAELSDLEVKLSEDGRPEINLSIDYIAPEHLSHSPEIYEREKIKLNSILTKFPWAALRRISEPYPFSINVSCTFSGDFLTKMRFG